MKKQSNLRINKSKGITLIALVVTIVVLLILAGVSIVVLFGDNGLIKQAKESSLQTKFADVEERANVIYADLDSKRYATGNINKKVTMGEIAKELSNLKYDIKEKEVGENVVEAIELKPTSIKIGKNAPATIEVTLKKNDEGMEYYVKVEDKYYKISLENRHITLDRTNGKLANEIEESTNTETTTQNLTAVSSNEDIVTVKETIDDNTIQIESKANVGNAEITVTYGDLKPQICKVTVAIQPIEGSTNIDNPITTNYGRIDVIWLDENNKVIPEPNKPILESEKNGTVEAKTKMRAVKWIEKEDGTIEEAPADETNPDKEWYDYREKDIEEGVAGSSLADNTTSHWANAKTENGSYFVWIPRYAYRITYYEDETSTTPTGYYDGNGMWSAEDGKKKLDLEEGIETVKYNEELYIVHPAFGTTKTDELSKTQNIDLGGWDKPLTGFWFAKFEMSYTEEEGLKSIPGVFSQRNQTIGEFYTIARTANYGQVATTDAFDNKASFMNSHMCKNSEWGAVAYLTHSKYGRNGHEIAADRDFNFYTGGGRGIAYINVNKQLQSTTGNVYGVYDLRRGAWESTAIWNKKTSSNMSFENSFATREGTSTKYATAYNGTSNDTGIDIYIVCKTGDATKEIYTNRLGWFENDLWIIYLKGPFLTRGGYASGSGIFSSGNVVGGADSYISFRVVINPSTL